MHRISLGEGKKMIERLKGKETHKEMNASSGLAAECKWRRRQAGTEWVGSVQPGEVRQGAPRGS